jgi:hypothetical protein
MFCNDSFNRTYCTTVGPKIFRTNRGSGLPGSVLPRECEQNLMHSVFATKLLFLNSGTSDFYIAY